MTNSLESLHASLWVLAICSAAVVAVRISKVRLTWVLKPTGTPSSLVVFF